ncbi:hypothetical protein Tco_0528660 [Tanacetum coccineum]
MPAADSPTADSPGYIPESDPEEDPEEDDDKDPEEDPADYPADRGDDGDDGDDEDEPSDDDEDEEVDIKADNEEEEHPTPADSTAVALPAIDQASSAEETKPFETDESAATPPPHPAYRVTARISIPAPVPTTVWSDAEVFRLLAISTPPSSPLSPWSSSFPQIPSPPLPPILSPLPVSPPLPQFPHHHYQYEVGESLSAAARPAGGLRVDYGFVATMDREIRRDLERDVGYGITDSWDKIVEAMQGTLVVTDVAEFSQRMTEFETRAWGQSMDASDLMRAEVMSLHTQVVAQQAVITELQVADHRRQMVITEMLAADHKRQVQLTKALKLLKGPQTQMEELQRQQGPANGPAQPDAPEEAGSSIIFSCDLKKMAPKRRTTRLNPETTPASQRPTTTVTNAQLQAMINQGVTAVLAARDANTNGVDSHNSGTGARRNERATQTACSVGRMFPEESDKIEKYVCGLPDMIHRSVVASKPKTMQEATKMAIEVMYKRIALF